MPTLALLLPVLLQLQAAPPAPAEQPVSDDIVVSALRDIDRPDSAVTTATLGSQRTGNAIASRTIFGFATRFAACVVDRDPPQIAWLRKVVDGRTNSTAQAFALRRLAQTNIGCAPDATAARDGAIADPYYVRGALTIETIRRFAPKLRLTKRETADPAVQARFNARETTLARFRLPVDQRYFETAICFVRLQPELATRLALTAKPLDAIRRLEAAIVNRGRACVGIARKVYFDGTQFRFYIADAVYRWAVAARGADSLVPAD